MPVVMAKARARITAIFFMVVSPSSAMSRLPEQGKDIRDRHHVLELFRKKKATKGWPKLEETPRPLPQRTRLIIPTTRSQSAH